MNRSPWLVPLAVLIGIGCGSKPEEVSAKTEQVQPAAQMAQAPAAPAATGGSSVKGTVKFTGTAPKGQPVQMAADPVCQQAHPAPVYSEEVVVGEGGALKNVLVYVKEVPGSFPPASQPVVLDQSGCWYSPHVFGLQTNQPLEIVNDDPTMHNINAKPVQNPPFNIAQPQKGMKMTKSFPKPEVPVKFKCNVHPWMNAYAGVFTHPFFAVSGADGSFTLQGLPAGTYTVEAWHEKFGTQSQQVTVGDGETKSVSFSFSGS